MCKKTLFISRSGRFCTHLYAKFRGKSLMGMSILGTGMIDIFFFGYTSENESIKGQNGLRKEDNKVFFNN